MLRPLIAALAAVLLLVVGVEIGLRATGVGDPAPGSASTLRYQHIWPPLIAPGERPDGTAAWITTDPRTPWQAALAERPPGSLRIVVVGGSAVAGLGYGPNVSFPRHLERLLASAYPDRHIEVLNLGIVALSSREVRAIVDDVLPRLAPDALVVYSGNNEFLELHAEEFARLERSSWGQLSTALARTNTLRALRQAAGRGPRRRALSNNEMASADARVSEADLVAKIQTRPDQHRTVVDAYETNLEAIASSAATSGVPTLLCTVASNWKWRGREDLPEDWTADIGDDELPPPVAPADWARLLTAFERRGGPGQPEPGSHAWHFRRAVLAERAELWDIARDAYRDALNSDPHLRRATDELADRVRAVAARTEVVPVDTVAALAARSPHGIVGFEHFYDYVHFTPRGCIELAAILHDQLEALGLVSGPPALAPSDYAAAELARVTALETDPTDVDTWLGIGFGTERVVDRDLWKHAKAMTELTLVIESESEPAPRRALALAWRGNLNFFLIGGAPAARTDYEAALALRDDSVVRENLRRLTTTRHP